MTDDPPPIFAIADAATNAEVIEQLARPRFVEYLRPEWRTLDPTYGEGRFWTRWRPDDLVACDLNPAKSPIGRSVDFRPGLSGFPDNSFDAVVIDGPYKLCLDDETQVLTRRGWLRYDEVSIGDEAYSRDHASGMGCWRKITAVNVYPRSATDVLVCNGKNLNFVATPDHRWPVLDHRGTLVWRTTTTLGSQDRVVCAAPWDGTPTVAKYDDAFVELVAWFWTEGGVHAPNTTYGKITQSHVVNPEFCARIAAAFTALYGPPVEAFERVGRSSAAFAWRTYDEERNRRFVFSAPIGRQLLDAAPGKVPSREFIEALTTSQRELFIRTSTEADGHDPRRLSQSDPDRAESFAYACILSGRAVSILDHASRNGRTVTMKQAVAKPRRPGLISEVRETTVWCPTVDGTATWLARRNGTIYFTGNSGTSTGEGPSASDESYGVDVWAGVEARHALLGDMLREGVRVLRPAKRRVPGSRRTEMVGGYLLFKCQDQVNGGRMRWQTRIFADLGESLGLRLVSQVHLMGYRDQPARCVCTHHRDKYHPDRGPCTKPKCGCVGYEYQTAQDHPRSNYSTLLIFRDEREWTPPLAEGFAFTVHRVTCVLG